MQQYYHHILRFVEQMDTQEWAMAVVVVIIVGIVCMRGFGSRSNY